MSAWDHIQTLSDDSLYIAIDEVMEYDATGVIEPGTIRQMASHFNVSESAIMQFVFKEAAIRYRNEHGRK